MHIAASAAHHAISEAVCLAPSLTLSHIEGVVASSTYHVFEGTTLTVCCLTLKNGQSVTGESGCISRGRFNEQKGQEIARLRAIDKVWALEGYLLNEKLTVVAAALSAGGGSDYPAGHSGNSCAAVFADHDGVLHYTQLMLKQPEPNSPASLSYIDPVTRSVRPVLIHDGFRWAVLSGYNCTVVGSIAGLGDEA